MSLARRTSVEIHFWPQKQAKIGSFTLLASVSLTAGPGPYPMTLRNRHCTFRFIITWSGVQEGRQERARQERARQEDSSARSTHEATKKAGNVCLSPCLVRLLHFVSFFDCWGPKAGNVPTTSTSHEQGQQCAVMIVISATRPSSLTMRNALVPPRRWGT